MVLDNSKNITDEMLKEIPTEFGKVIKDFIRDLIRTFPDKITKESNNNLFLILEGDEDSIYNIYQYCKEIYPKHFFDILYQKDDIFNDKNDGDLLLKGVNFNELWNEEITQNTKDIIWKYFQLILFSIITDIKSDESFGDTSKLFEAINQDEFKEKIEETLKEMGNIFSQDVSNNSSPFNGSLDSDNIPNADDLHSHINEIMDGKLGCLAREIAEETVQDFNLDMEDADSATNIFKELFKNPTKLMDLVKTVGTKLDTKMKSGEIKESELLEEATNMIGKMKNMPGMNDMQNLFSNMGIPGIGKGKMDMGSLQKHMEQNLRNAKMKERMRTKLQKKENNDDLPVASRIADNKILSNGLNLDSLEQLVYTSPQEVEGSAKKPNKKKKKGKGKKK